MRIRAWTSAPLLRVLKFTCCSLFSRLSGMLGNWLFNSNLRYYKVWWPALCIITLVCFAGCKTYINKFPSCLNQVCLVLNQAGSIALWAGSWLSNHDGRKAAHRVTFIQPQSPCRQEIGADRQIDSVHFQLLPISFKCDNHLNLNKLRLLPRRSFCEPAVLCLNLTKVWSH